MCSIDNCAPFPSCFELRYSPRVYKMAGTLLNVLPFWSLVTTLIKLAKLLHNVRLYKYLLNIGGYYSCRINPVEQQFRQYVLRK